MENNLEQIKKMNCISCNTTYDSNFCPNCGERSGDKKITLNSLLQGAFATLTNMDQGFLYNLKTLLLKPDTITTEYILGKRRGILNPISYLIISISLYLIIESSIRIPDIKVEPFLKSEEFSSGYSLGKAAGKFIFAYLKYFWICSILLLGISTKIIFGKYNFLEHVTISAFIIGQATLLGLFVFFIFSPPLLFNPIIYFVILIMLFQIFKDGKDKIEAFILSISGLLLFMLLLFIVIILVGLIMRYL